MTFDILFPIADHVMNPFVVFIIGMMGGLVSSMLGIGGGVVVTPMLIMVGIPPLVAVTSQLNNSIGTNFMGFISYWRQRDVDFALAWYLFIGGVVGAFGEFFVLELVATNITAAQKLTVITIVVLGALGLLMLYQNIRLITHPQRPDRSVLMRHWMIYLPFHRIFTRARVEMSILVPIFVGIATGMLTSTLGGSNSLFIMPIVYYLIGRSSPVVAGTTLLAAFAITTVVTIVHAFGRSPSDYVLVLILLFGSAFGSQFGVKFSYRIPRPYLGLMGASVILLICSKFTYHFLYLGGKNPVTSPGANQIDLKAAFFTTPEWALWMVKMAHDTPVTYALVGIMVATFLAFCIERILCRYIRVYKHEPVLKLP